MIAWGEFRLRLGFGFDVEAGQVVAVGEHLAAMGGEMFSRYHGKPPECGADVETGTGAAARTQRSDVARHRHISESVIFTDCGAYVRWGLTCMRRVLQVLAISAGAVLLLPLMEAVIGRPSELQPGAFAPLVRVPLRELHERRSLAVKLVVPNDEEIGARDLNDHRYIVIAASSERVAHCWNGLGIKVSARTAGQALAIQNANGAPYAWSSRCGLSGVVFYAAAKEEVELIFETGPGGPFPGELLVLPFLRGPIKDRIVGSLIHRDLVKLSWFTTPVGVLLIAAGVTGMMRKRVVMLLATAIVNQGCAGFSGEYAVSAPGGRLRAEVGHGFQWLHSQFMVRVVREGSQPRTVFTTRRTDDVIYFAEIAWNRQGDRVGVLAVTGPAHCVGYDLRLEKMVPCREVWPLLNDRMRARYPIPERMLVWEWMRTVDLHSHYQRVALRGE